MHPEIHRRMAHERAAALRRRPRSGRGMDGDLVIRSSRPGEAAALAELALLDDATAPSGPALVAEVDGDIRAALPLDGGRPIADPFRRTSDLVALLEARAAQLRGGPPVTQRLGIHVPAALRRLV